MTIEEIVSTAMDFKGTASNGKAIKEKEIIVQSVVVLHVLERRGNGENYWKEVSDLTLAIHSKATKTLRHLQDHQGKRTTSLHVTLIDL